MGNLSVDKLASPGQRSVVSVYLRRPYHRVCISAKGSQAQKPNVGAQPLPEAEATSGAYAVGSRLKRFVRL